MSRSPRILLVRVSAIGDIVFASPLIAAFRRAHPDAYIAWLAQPECRPLLEHHPALDEVITWPLGMWKDLWRSRRWGALTRAVRGFRRELRELRFDLAVDLQGLLKSGILTRLSGAPQRIGLGSREGSRWLMTRTIPRDGDPARIGSEYRFLAETLGLHLGEFGMEIHGTEEDTRFAQDLIVKQRLEPGYAVICPFTTRPQKHWLEGRWAELASRIDEELGLRVLMLGSRADRPAAARIRRQGAPGLIDLAGRTSLLQAAALIERCALLVAVDTGLGHMGIAYARPSLLLFGSTCPYRDTGRDNARVLYHPMPCSPCKRRPTCDGAFTCMQSIEVDEVLRAASGLLERAP